MFFLKRQEVPVKGYLFIALLVCTNLLLWLICLNSSSFFFISQKQLYGEILGSTGLTLLFSVVLLASRLKPLEQFFDGLDRMYVVHRHLAIATIATVYLHSRVISDLSGIKEGVAGSLGGTSLDLMLYLSIWALFPRICRWLTPIAGYLPTKFPAAGQKTTSLVSSGRAPFSFFLSTWDFLKTRYRIWQLGHKIMWIAFLLATTHVLLVESYARRQPLLLSFYVAITAVGALVFGLKYFGNTLTKKKVIYSVNQILRPSSDIMMLTMAPTSAGISYHSGQFAFLHFPLIKGLNDPHPFTLTSNPTDSTISMTIKTGGDFTRQLKSGLSVGSKAVIEGGYGCFDFTKEKRNQVWIAGGIGITPFISWLNSLDQLSVNKVDLFYSMKSSSEYLYAETLEKWTYPQSPVTIHLVDTSVEQRLSVSTIFGKCEAPHERAFFLCGPEQMVGSLYKQLRQTGIPEKRIHYEFFQFR